MEHWKPLLAVIGGILASFGAAWKLLDKFDKKGDKKAINEKRLADVENSAKHNSKEIALIRKDIVVIDKAQALQAMQQDVTNKHLEEIKSLLYASMSVRIIENKKHNHETTFERN